MCNKKVSTFFSDYYISFIILWGAFSFLIMFGYGLFRNGDFCVDFEIFYDAGYQIRNKINPWLNSIQTGKIFSYPPHISSLLVFYSYFSLQIAKVIHTSILSVTLVGFLYFINRYFVKLKTFKNLKKLTINDSMIFAIAVSNPFVCHNIFMGQTGLLIVLFVLIAWHYYYIEKNILISGIFLGLSTLKPQISVFLIFWLILDKQYKIILIGFFTSIILMLPAILELGIIETFSSWILSVKEYSVIRHNVMGNFHVIGIPSFISSIITTYELGLIKYTFLFLLFLSVFFMFKIRRKLSAYLIISYLMSAPMLYYAHDYDLASLFMIFGFLIIRKVSNLNLIYSYFLLFCIFFPSRFVAQINFEPIHHWRTIVLVLMLYEVISYDYKECKDIN